MGQISCSLPFHGVPMDKLGIVEQMELIRQQTTRNVS